MVSIAIREGLGTPAVVNASVSSCCDAVFAETLLCAAVPLAAPAELDVPEVAAAAAGAELEAGEAAGVGLAPLLQPPIKSASPSAVLKAVVGFNFTVCSFSMNAALAEQEGRMCGEERRRA